MQTALDAFEVVTKIWSRKLSIFAITGRWLNKDQGPDGLVQLRGCARITKGIRKGMHEKRVIEWGQVQSFKKVFWSRGGTCIHNLKFNFKIRRGQNNTEFLLTAATRVTRRLHTLRQLISEIVRMKSTLQFTNTADDQRLNTTILFAIYI